MGSAWSLEELFTEALRIPEGAEREAWMDVACDGERAQLLRRILAAYAEMDPSFLASPLTEPTSPTPLPTPDAESGK